MMQPNYKLAKLQQDFKNFYDRNLRHKYMELEPARKEFLQKFWRRFTFSCIIAFVIFLLCKTGTISKGIYTSEGFFKLCILGVVVAFYLCSVPFAEYKSETKSLVMDKILSFWGTFKYSVVSTINPSDLEKSELFSHYDIDKTDDSFSGSYNDTQISVSEKNLRVKGSKHDYTIFKGIVILLEFNKQFKCKTVVKHRWNINSLWRSNLQLYLSVFLLLIAIGIFIQIFTLAEDAFEVALFAYMTLFFGILAIIYFAAVHKKRKTATQHVTLEKIAFNKNWNVLTTDQIEARYILTPTFMEKIDAVKKLFHGQHIDFCFYENKLLMAVHTRKDMFETTFLFTPALDYHKVREVVSQLYSIFSVIDVLNLTHGK